MARKLIVEIVGDSTSLERAYDRSTRASKKFGQDMQRSKGGTVLAAAGFQDLRQEALLTSRALVGGGGAAGIAIALRQSVGAASDLNEQTERSRQIFRGASREVERFAESASDIGIARAQALEAAGTFGGLFRTLGTGPKVAAELSRELVELAADLSSFGNTDPAEALTALRAGLIGEAEPLRRFNVRLTEARVQQDALAASGKRVASELTDQEKVMARYRIILEDTAIAQGDVARTSESFANQQRRLRAQLTNLSADIGGLVLPTLTRYIDKLNEGIGGARDFARAVDQIDIPALPDPGEGFTAKVGRSIKERIIEQFTGPGLKDIGRTLAEGIAPGVDALERAGKAVEAFRQEAETPVNFSAVDALMGGLPKLEAGIVAMDKIEAARTRLGRGGPNITNEQRNAFFDARIGRSLDQVQDADLKDQLTKLRVIESVIEQQIAAVSDITRKLTLRDQLLEVQRQQRGVREQIAQDLVDRVSLGLARAQLTDTVEDDLRALDAIAGALNEQVRVVGRTVDIESQLIGIQAQRADLIAEQRQQAQDEALGRLQLAVDRAELTRGASDDLAAIAALEAFLRAQVRASGSTITLEQQLLDIVRQRAAIAEQQRDALEEARKKRKEARDALQFQALGLSATGQERVPGLDALRRELLSVDAALEGTFLDTKKTESLMTGIRRVLSGKLGEVSRDVRSKVAELLSDLKRQLEDFGRSGPKTLSKALDVSEALKGLSGSQEALAAARNALAGAVVPVRPGGAAIAGVQPTLVVHSYVDLDGQRVATNTTKYQERDSQRTAPARRG